jgi:hypothetical protein
VGHSKPAASPSDQSGPSDSDDDSSDGNGRSGAPPGQLKKSDKQG